MSCDDERPDGRKVTAETLMLRKATRALRLHLDELPIDYDLDVSGDRFLAGLAFMFAGNRYDCAESLLGAGFGGSVVGSIARSLFVDGLRWLWIAEQPDRRRALLGDLRDERNRLCITLERTKARCGNLPRWLMPLPDVADLTGASMTWVNAPAMPDENDLLDDFLSRRGDQTPSDDTGEHAELLHRTHALLDMSGLRGAVMVLDHAGHGNHLGLMSSLTDDGAAGHDLRHDHEALFMQVAAAGVTATLLGTAAAIPEAWPVDVPRQPFLDRAVELSADVTAAAVPIHKLDTAQRPAPRRKTKDAPQRRAELLRPQAILAADDLLPDTSSTHEVIEAAESFKKLAKSLMVRPWEHGQPTLHAMLAYGGGHSNLDGHEHLPPARRGGHRGLRRAHAPGRSRSHGVALLRRRRLGCVHCAREAILRRLQVPPEEGDQHTDGQRRATSPRAANFRQTTQRADRNARRRDRQEQATTALDRQHAPRDARPFPSIGMARSRLFTSEPDYAQHSHRPLTHCAIPQRWLARQ